MTAMTILDSSPKVSSALFCPQAPGTPHGAQTDTHSDKNPYTHRVENKHFLNAILLKALPTARYSAVHP